MQKPSAFTGMRVRIFVGEYVGPENHAIAALQASRKNRNMTAALRGLLSQHASDEMFSYLSDNSIHNLSVPRLNEVFEKQTMQVSSEMIPVVEKWSQSTSGCL